MHLSLKTSAKGLWACNLAHNQTWFYPNYRLNIYLMVL